MAATAVEQVYRYAGASRVGERDGRPDVGLATSGGASEHPRFFAGWVEHAPPCARAMLVVSRTARSRFHVPAAMLEQRLLLADPVVTADRAALRFEAFSACCGVYARLDVDAAGLDGELLAEGTTNVDFNPPMREALAGVVAGGPLHLTVGADEVGALTESGSVVERRVPLPARWVKGFGEVQVAQAAMDERLDLPGVALRRLLRELPRSGPAGAVVYVRRSGRDVRLSRMGGRDAVALAGPRRLTLVDPLVADARRLRVYGAADGSGGWVVDLPGGRLTLALSPEVWRGFSGEGGVLRDAAAGDEQAAQGMAGFDLAAGSFFARRLPFDLGAVERLNPRLRDARRLVEAGAVRIASSGAEAAEAYVSGRGAEYHVRLAGDDGRCTCPWYARHAGARGPCKHVLATELALAEHAAR